MTRSKRRVRGTPRRPAIPLQPPRRVGGLPDLPLPAWPRDPEAPGARATRILWYCLTGQRSQWAQRSYAVFDQLPRAIRNLINDSEDIYCRFKYHVEKGSSIQIITSDLKRLNRTTQTVHLADL
jgi:hypothetical protein